VDVNRRVVEQVEVSRASDDSDVARVDLATPIG